MILLHSVEVLTNYFFFKLFKTNSKTTQRNKQIAMGRKKFNMDPKKVRELLEPCGVQRIN